MIQAAFECLLRLAAEVGARSLAAEISALPNSDRIYIKLGGTASQARLFQLFAWQAPELGTLRVQCEAVEIGPNG